MVAQVGSIVIICAAKATGNRCEAKVQAVAPAMFAKIAKPAPHRRSGRAVAQ